MQFNLIFMFFFKITTVTKVVREVHHMIPNSLDYIPYSVGGVSSSSSTQPNNSSHMSESG